MPTVKDVIVRKPEPGEEEKLKKWSVWSCDTSTFDWDYTEKETCLILQGEVTVTDRPPTQDSVSFSQGDVVEFPPGLKCIWNVKKPVKKHYNFG
jgi:hypothetical protein